MTRKTDHFAFLDRARGDPDVYPLEVRRTEFREIYKPYSPEEAAEQAGQKHDWEDFTRLRLSQGGDLRKYYPLNDEARVEYEEWRKTQGK